MKFLLALTALLTTAVLMTGAGPSAAATYIGHEKVSEAVAKGGPLANAPDYTVLGNHRTGPGEVEVHEKETDIFYVVEGSATFITGGTMVGGKMTKPGQIRGTDIQGGQTQHLTKGDVIVIPAGTPHWFKEIPQVINYYVVKVIKP